MLNHVTASWTSTKGTTHTHTCVCAIYSDWARLDQKEMFSLTMLWVKWQVVGSLKAGLVFSFVFCLFVCFSGEKRLYSELFFLHIHSRSPSKQALSFTCQEYWGLYHQQSPVSIPWPTLYCYIIHLFKNQIILILYSSQKRDKNVTVNASIADVVYSKSTVKL